MARSIHLAVAVAIGAVLFTGSAAFAASISAKLLNVVTSRTGYSIEAGVSYGALARHKLDLYIPDDVQADAPVVVFFYGGGWNRGERADYLFVGQSLASAGYIVIIPDYRLHPEVVFPEFVVDAAEAVAYVHDRFRGSGKGRHPLFLAGHSAGAHIAALINLDERYLAASGVPSAAIAGVVGLSGPYDFLPLRAEIFKQTFPEAVREESQPIRFVDGSEAPMLLITGAADRVVDPGNSTRLAATIHARDGIAEATTYPRLGHAGTVGALATARPWRKPPIRQAMIDFIRARSAERGKE